jgi:hypothetical protein
MTDNAIIQKAFNAGYLIEKYLPRLFTLLAKGFQDKSNPFAEAFIAGGLEFDMEQMRVLTSVKQEPEQSLEAPEDDLEL